MRVEWGLQPIGIGWIIALITLVVVVVLWFVGGVDHQVLALIGALAVARLT